MCLPRLTGRMTRCRLHHREWCASSQRLGNVRPAQIERLELNPADLAHLPGAQRTHSDVVAA